MPTSRRNFLLATSSTLWLAACGGGGGDSDDNQNPPPVEQTITWSVAARGPMGFPLSDVAYGNGILVALGSNGIGDNADKFNAMSYSEDGGQTWTAVAITGLGDFAYLQGAAFGSGRFIAVTAHGHVITSTNGKAWTIALEAEAHSDIFFPNNFQSVVYGNGVFLVLGQRDNVSCTWISEDGLTWSEARPSDYPFLVGGRLVHVKDTFYLLGGDNVAMSTGTGETWTSFPVTVDGQSVEVVGLAYGKGTYVAITWDGFVATSPDFTTWTVRTQLDAHGVLRLWFINETFLLAMSEKIYNSADGVSWKEAAATNLGDSVQSMTFDGTRYIAVGDPGLTVIGTIT